jgi:predicted nucleic acid-binding protein
VLVLATNHLKELAYATPMDLRIACITLVLDATLLTRNTVDFA